MPRDSAYLPTVGAIYETLVSPHSWPDALDFVARFSGADGGMLISYDAADQDLRFEATSPHYSPDSPKEYASRIDATEARWVAVLDAQPAGTVVRDSMVWQDRAAYAAMPAVQWLQDRGLFHRASMRLGPRFAQLELIALTYRLGRDGMTASEACRLQQLQPHLAHAAEVRRPFALLQRMYGSVLSVLDRLAIGIFILRENCEIVLANHEAERILGAVDGLARDARNRLACYCAEATCALQRAVLAAARSRSEDPSACLGILALPKRSSGQAYQCDVAPLSLDALGAGPGALLTAVDPDRRAAAAIGGLADVCGLTAAEAAVCHLIADGLTASEIAEERGVALTTVKSQARSILSKTSTRNRAELLRRALTVSPLLIDAPAVVRATAAPAAGPQRCRLSTGG